MRKKAAKPVLALLLVPDFQAVQSEWYAKLKESGFEDIEDIDRPGFEDGRPLKKWTGISGWATSLEEVPESVFDFQHYQPEEAPILSSWPEPVFKQEEDFSHHPSFNQICIQICSHGNSRCTPEVAIRIWNDYCSGDSERALENRYGISDTAVRRILTQLTEWMNMIETQPAEDREPIKIVIRDFIPESDSAFLFSSWRNNLWYDEDRDDKQSHAFYSAATRAIKKLLSMPGVKINIACSFNDPDHIIGYSLLTGENLEWVYVKIEYREKGIATLLARGFKTVSDPQTKIGKSIAETHKLTIQENTNGPTNPARIQTKKV